MPAMVAGHPVCLTGATCLPTLTRKDGKMPNQPKSNRESNQPNRGQESSGSVQSSRDNPSRKGVAGEREDRADLSFRCADLGHSECSWSVTGRSHEELLPKIEQHGREKHDIKTFDSQTREKIR